QVLVYRCRDVGLAGGVDSGNGRYPVGGKARELDQRREDHHWFCRRREGPVEVTANAPGYLRLDCEAVVAVSATGRIKADAVLVAKQVHCRGEGGLLHRLVEARVLEQVERAGRDRCALV